MTKPIVCIDFDGVIHSYDRGWQDGSIYGTVTEGFWEWAIAAEPVYRLVVYSSRSKDTGGVAEMTRWLDEQWQAWKDKDYFVRPLITFAHEKPAAFVTIDDRCVRFDGNWYDEKLQPDALLKYKPWNLT